MNPRTLWASGLATLCVAGLAPLLAQGQSAAASHRNVLIFVADGLRHGSVNEQDTPALWAVRTQGVHFENSHSVFPTLTMANASAIATGHGLGDTGIFANTLWPGFALFDTGNFDLLPGSPVPFLEDDRTLADLDDHFGGNVLGSDTLLALARAHGYRTAVVGKKGPTAVQDLAAMSPVEGRLPTALPGLIVDDFTGAAAGLPWPQDLASRMLLDGVASIAPTRSNGYGAASRFNNAFSGDRSTAGTLAANVVQQEWLDDIATRYVLPSLTKDPDTPFLMVHWTRDPDGTQHDQGDSLNTLFPGINGDTSRRAVRAADRSLRRLMAWFDAHPDVKANTDIVVTSDHGFATISRSEIDRTGRRTARESAQHDYLGPRGNIDTLKGTLPFGCLALDLAYDLQLDVFDPDQHPQGSRLFKRLRIGSSGNAIPLDTWEHPLKGNAFIGVSVRRPDGADARLIVAANGGVDLIYVPDGDAATLQRALDRVLTYDYVSGVFVDDKYGMRPGTLPLSTINLVGSSKVPRPAMVVAFKYFYMNPLDLQTAVQISDTSLQEGQGMHGGLGRDSTFNNMAALGPDFKRDFVDPLPAGNADIAPTLAHLLGFDLPRTGLVGRVLAEALSDGPAAAPPRVQYLRSTAAAGAQTILAYQEHDGVRYLDRACFVAPATADDEACR
jgi:predicted AlkP superfamily pyrophosphatase or phosphodiesterase